MVKEPQLDEICELNRGCLQCQLSISWHLDCWVSKTLQIICIPRLDLFGVRKSACFDQLNLEGLVVWGSALLLLLPCFLHHLLVHPATR